MKAFQILSSLVLASSLLASNVSAEPTATLAPTGDWTLKYSWSGVAACANGTATYSTATITFSGGPTTGTFAVGGSTVGTWAQVGSQFMLTFSSTPGVYSGQIQNKVAVGANSNNSSSAIGCFYMYSGSTAPAALIEAESNISVSGLKK